MDPLSVAFLQQPSFFLLPMRVTFRGSWSFTGRLIDNSMHEVETRLKHDFRSGTNKFYGKRIFTREDLTFDKISMVFR